MESKERADRIEGLSLLDALERYLDILTRDWAGTPEAERYQAVRLSLDASRRARRLLRSGLEGRGGDDAT